MIGADAQPRQTLRYRPDSTPPLGDCPLTYTPAPPTRRWARILRAVRATPNNTAALHRLVGRRNGSRKDSRGDEYRTLRSIGSLVRCGLLIHTGQGLLATREGLEILARAEADAGWAVTTTPEQEGRQS